MGEQPQGPLRVGLVIGQLSTGGAEGQLRLLCEGFDRSRVTPFVYCLSDRTRPYGDLLRDAGVPVRVVGRGRLRRVRALRRAWAADRIEVVHAWLFIANAYAWVATRGGGLPLVTAARNCKRSGRLLDALNRWAFRASGTIIVNSRQVGDYIAREYGAPRDSIRVVYNAIDLRRFRPREDGQASPAPRVVMVGRLVEQKNPQLFVAAAVEVRKAIPGVQFQIVGDGPLRGALELAIARAGLADCVSLLGERRDVPEVLRDAQVFWSTSDWEGLPNAVIEAMACGLAVVATDVGGTAELVTPGTHGWLIAAGDRAALVARTVELLSDPTRLAAMQIAARRRAESFSLEAMVDATVAAYGAAMDRRTS